MPESNMPRRQQARRGAQLSRESLQPPAGYNLCMGLTTLTVLVANVNDVERTIAVQCLVDSGAVHSVIQSDVLEQLGIKPFTR